MTTENNTIPAPAATLTVERETWLELQALIHSIAFMQVLPEGHRMPSDLRDACKLARHMASPALASLVLDVKKRTGIDIDLWPERETLTAQEQHERKAFLYSFGLLMNEYQQALNEFAAHNPLNSAEAA